MNRTLIMVREPLIGWRRVKSPNPNSHARLYGITAQSGPRVWAVGYTIKSNVARALIMRWNGTKWTVVDHAAPRMSYLFGATRIPGTNGLRFAGTATPGLGRNLVLGCTW